MSFYSISSGLLVSLGKAVLGIETKAYMSGYKFYMCQTSRVQTGICLQSIVICINRCLRVDVTNQRHLFYIFSSIFFSTHICQNNSEQHALQTASNFFREITLEAKVIN